MSPDVLARRTVTLVLATSTGGVGRHVRSLVDGLLAVKARTVVCGPSDTDARFGWSAAGTHFRAVEIASGARAVKDLRALRALRRALADAEVVHAHGLRAGFLAGLANKDVPLVVTWHNAVTGRLAETVERYVAGRADVTLCASSDLVTQARAKGAGDVRLAPVGAPPLPPPATRLDLGERVVLAIGRLHAQKGFDVLVDAATRLDARIHIAGEGPMRADLEKRIARTGAPVTLLGHRDDVSDLLAAADVLVISSRWEARALVAQEAVRAGVPVVATEVGGLPELLGDAAEWVRPEDPLGLANAIRDVLADPAPLVEAGRRRARTWPSSDDTVAEVLALYRDLLR